MFFNKNKSNVYQATYKGKVIAQSSDTIAVEGNQYFPREAVNFDLIVDSSSHSVCGWKGTASYYDVVIDGETIKDAAWYYPQPLDAAQNIKNYIAFWKGVKVEGVSSDGSELDAESKFGSAEENGIIEGTC